MYSLYSMQKFCCKWLNSRYLIADVSSKIYFHVFAPYQWLISHLKAFNKYIWWSFKSSHIFSCKLHFPMPEHNQDSFCWSIYWVAFLPLKITRAGNQIYSFASLEWNWLFHTIRYDMYTLLLYFQSRIESQIIYLPKTTQNISHMLLKYSS